MSTEPASSDTNKLLAALAYPIWIVALVIVLTDMKKNPFMRHHGWTALFWGLAWVVIFIGLNIIINVVGFLAFLSGGLLQLAWFILSLYFAFQAYNGKEVTIPVVSDFAKKYAGSAS
jgi:uncharacterized membrane protein